MTNEEQMRRWVAAMDQLPALQQHLAEAPLVSFLSRHTTHDKAQLLRNMRLRHSHSLDQGRVIRGMAALLDAVVQVHGDQVDGLSLIWPNPDGTSFNAPPVANLFYPTGSETLLGVLYYQRTAAGGFKIVYET